MSPRENYLNCFDPKGKTLELYIQYKQWCLKQKAAFSLCCFDFDQRLQCNQLWQCLILHFYM